jgi:hypothetical protein
MALAAAKEAARGLLVDMRRGLDPKRKGTGTLGQTLNAYLQSNKDINRTACGARAQRIG